MSEISVPVLEQIEQLGPFGMANAVPKIVFRDVVIKDVRKIGKEGKHLKLRIQQKRDVMDAISFGWGHLADILPVGTVVDVLGELSVNEWNGSRKVQLMVQDIRASYQQVFDYRGIQEPLKEIQRWRADLEPHLRCPAARSAVVYAKDSHPEIKTQLYDMCLWVYDRNAGVLPDNEIAENHNQEDISVLFVLDVPETAEQLDGFMSAFHSVPNIFMLHPTRSQRERLLIPDREQFKKLVRLHSTGMTSSPMAGGTRLLRVCSSRLPCLHAC
ncbi:single-stranded-DNA-specific exonuclease C-terminal domain-containing protein [Paenibacillus vortex]|uniref:single-stranded-DNA-specific exonuclease C-terminal domain-containing protein n=1 Tax=Paenibacillus vortex TaxID=71995 RepID=UPI00228362AF|nr:single-stranded-DNA-specific exonuclease C-terminal domain-containing protein [Paenibacillus vortex]